MVWKTAIKRVKNGKTLRIDIDIEDNTIKDIVISGDFFAYPEESIDKLEQCLKGREISTIMSCIDEIKETTETIGISFEDVTDLIYYLCKA